MRAPRWLLPWLRVWLSAKGRDKQARARSRSHASFPPPFLTRLPRRRRIGCVPLAPPSCCRWSGPLALLGARRREFPLSCVRLLPPPPSLRAGSALASASRSLPPAPARPRLGGPMAYSQGGGKKKVCYYYDGERGRRGSACVWVGGALLTAAWGGLPPSPAIMGAPSPAERDLSRLHGDPRRGSPPPPPAPPRSAPAIGPADSRPAAGLSPRGCRARGKGRRRWWRRRRRWGWSRARCGSGSCPARRGAAAGPRDECCVYCVSVSPQPPQKKNKSWDTPLHPLSTEALESLPCLAPPLQKKSRLCVASAPGDSCAEAFPFLWLSSKIWCAEGAGGLCPHPKRTCIRAEAWLPRASPPAKHWSCVRRCLIIVKFELLAGLLSLHACLMRAQRLVICIVSHVEKVQKACA